MHKTILICLLKCLSICVFAQNEEENNRDIILLYVPVKETYLITGVGLNQFTQLETMVSPLVYKGIGAGASIGLQRRKKERITLLNTHWSKANLYNSFQPKQYSSALTHINLSASTCYLINKIQIKNITTRIGWQLSHQSDFRSNSQLQNSSLTYNFTTTLSHILKNGLLSQKTNNVNSLKNNAQCVYLINGLFLLLLQLQDLHLMRSEY